jgi:hypothetical protein
MAPIAPSAEERMLRETVPLCKAVPGLWAGTGDLGCQGLAQGKNGAIRLTFL